jgi:enoyl-CoA hydratase/carnithine racemase
VIAAVNGAALGAGLDLALCCDLRVAGEDAVFESTWIKAGLIPGMAGARLLPQVIGAGPAARMLLLGGRVDAQQALALGLVDAVAQDPVAAAEEMAGTIASLSYDAVSRTKAALRRGLDQGLDAELDVLGAQQGQLLDGDEFRAFASRFISKSRPSEGR